MPAVKFLLRLDLEEKISFLDGHWITSKVAIMKKIGTLGKDKSVSTSDSVTEISKVAVIAFTITAGLIGIWAMACMIAGISNSGGPVTLMSDLFKTIFG